MKKLGIVGSRERFSLKEYNTIEKMVKELKPDVIVSGGASGIDTLAKLCAKNLRIRYVEFPIKKPDKHIPYQEFVELAYARNKEIADFSDILLAMPLNRSGGTMNTVKWFREKPDFDESNLIIID